MVQIKPEVKLEMGRGGGGGGGGGGEIVLTLVRLHLLEQSYVPVLVGFHVRSDLLWPNI